MTVFDTATDTLFADPNLALDAVYRVGGAGAGVPVRIIRINPADLVVKIGDIDIVSSTELFAIRRSDATAPRSGDTVTLTLTNEVLNIQGAPSFDQLKQVWTCDGGG